MEYTAKICKGNIKTGKSVGTWSKLKGNKPINSKFGDVIGSCGRYCDGCEEDCYVNKSYRYPSVRNRHSENTIAFRENLEEAFKQIETQCKRKRKPFKLIRIDQSGEIETTTELIGWITQATRFPNCDYFIYTKNEQAVYEVDRLNIEIPKNFTCLLSAWHKYGLEFYKQMQDRKWIKCFVVVDGYKYPEWLKIETMCGAYDINGKIDHRITCDKCKKCPRHNEYKVIGCYKH